MKSLRAQLLGSFTALIFFLGTSVGILGTAVIKRNIIDRAQKEVENSLKTAEAVYQQELDIIEKTFSVIENFDNLSDIRLKAGLDYLTALPPEDAAKGPSPAARRAAYGLAEGGTRLMRREELAGLSRELAEKARITILPTPKARPSSESVLEDAMVIEYAKPVFDENGRVSRVMLGGKLINRDFTLVDKIRDYVFENRIYKGRALGTVTIFLGDARITTNVLAETGERAVGTRVSASVHEAVLEKGSLWIDRAFVVNDWYLTAYKPIKDMNGNIIGILYVGLLERPFKDLERTVMLSFFGILFLTAGLAAVFSYILEERITRPIEHMLHATTQISSGDLQHRLSAQSRIQEMDILASSFNNMAQKLHERETSLKLSNEKLETLNKTYLDLIGFVAHELKGILASTILNAYTVRDGYLGMINFKQRKALDSVARNLDYLSATVKNFLNLSRIEKGEMTVNKREVLLFDEVIAMSIDAFLKPASEKGMSIYADCPVDFKVSADPDLLLIVINNLLGNAVKYGSEKGEIFIKTRRTQNDFEIEVYNDGTPISDENKDRLFKKFSRLHDTAESRKAPGTGLGLFITKEIVERLGGSIRLERRHCGNSFIFTVERGQQPW